MLLLDSLYEPETRQGNQPCPAHPRTARPWQRSAFSDYAADMTVALAYGKRRDDWKDDGDLIALAESAALRRAYRAVQKEWPRQCAAIDEGLRALSRLENAGPENVDKHFGR